MSAATGARPRYSGFITLPILSKHIENLERIKQGKELKLDFLWDKDGELDRIGYVESEF